MVCFAQTLFLYLRGSEIIAATEVGVYGFKLWPASGCATIFPLKKTDILDLMRTAGNQRSV